ncbi:uncharacterized protein [Haliotis cracherodii]|uniref:uncharacterized protein isoform X1 n=1 Tax=Haliotis cracherodii TaxID=6455 RepID=UPI0039EBBF58
MAAVLKLCVVLICLGLVESILYTHQQRIVKDTPHVVDFGDGEGVPDTEPSTGELALAIPLATRMSCLVDAVARVTVHVAYMTKMETFTEASGHIQIGLTQSSGIKAIPNQIVNAPCLVLSSTFSTRSTSKL